MIRNLPVAVIAVLGLFLAGPPSPLAAQTTRPAGEPPASQPEGKAVLAKVVSVTGSVQCRSASEGGPFRPVAKGDLLAGDTLVCVGAKGQVVITFGENSVVVLEQFSAMTIDKVFERYQEGKPTVVTRLKLVNGSVRAGVERGQTQSDFQVATPVATLSVRGTRPIRVFYDSGVGQLWFFLAREGMMTGKLAGGGRSIDVHPGEGTDETLTLPVLMALFDRYIALGDPWGETLAEYLVKVTNPNALGNFGGGSPQTLQSIVQAGDRGQASGDSSHPRPPADDDSFYDDDDDSFYGDSTITGGRSLKKPKGK